MTTERDEKTYTCRFCAQIIGRGEAIQDGWIPSFWIDEVEVDNPVCPDCSAKFLDYGDDKEYGLRDGCSLPEAIN